MNFRSPRQRTSPAVSMVSMADIAFLLIVFFMVTTSFTRGPEIEVLLPEASTGEPSEQVAAVTVAIGEDGTVRVDGTVVRLDELAARLEPLVRALPRPVVVLAADRRAAFDLVVKAMDACRSVGVRELDISVEEPAP